MWILRRELLAIAALCLAACAGGRAEPSHIQGADPVIADHDQVQSLETELDGQLGASQVTDCPEAARLRDQICKLSDRICMLSSEANGRMSLCEDGRARCERAKSRVAERCP